MNRNSTIEKGKNIIEAIHITIQDRPRTSSSCNAQGLKEVNENTQSSLNSYNQEVD